MLEAEGSDVAAACRRPGAARLLLGTAGNVSVRAEDQVAITPTGAVLAELEPEMVTVVDAEGRVVAGELAPTSELDLPLGAPPPLGPPPAPRLLPPLRRRRGGPHACSDGHRALLRPRR